MRTLTTTLKAAQAGNTMSPTYEVEIYSSVIYPTISAKYIGWGPFSLQKLYEGEDALLPHCVAMPSDGSLNRFKLSGNKIYHQRVASPTESSTYSGAWTEIASSIIGTAKSFTCCASLASNNIYLFYPGLYYIGDEETGSWQYQLCYRKSTDGGATWGSQTAIGSALYDPSFQIISACMTGADTFAIWSTIGGTHRISYGSIGSLSSYTASVTDTVISVAMVYDTALNIVMEVDPASGDVHRLAHAVYDPGVSWTAPEYMDNLSGATVNTFSMLTQEEQEWWDPSNLLHVRQPEYRTVYSKSYNNPDYIGQDTGFTRDIDQHYITKRIKGRAVRRVPITGWKDSIDDSGALYHFLCKPTSAPALLSFGRTDTTPNQRWFYRVKAGETLDNCTIIDDAWEYAAKQYLVNTYGMALACDSNNLWVTNNNEVWRSPLPGKRYIPFTVSSTVGETPDRFTTSNILNIKEEVNEEGGTLIITVDNSTGAYADLPDSAIDKGSKVLLKYGFTTGAGNEQTYQKTYYLDEWAYGRSNNLKYVTFVCVDAWTLLSRFTMPNEFEYNRVSHECTIYDIIEDMIQCIGGTLGYESRSTEIAAIYPHLTISAGESAASIIKRMLELVKDVLKFDGLAGTIVYPLTSDYPCYSYFYPEP